MGLFRSIGGILHGELTSADIPGVMGAIHNLGVPIFDVRQMDEVTIQFSARRMDFPKIQKVAARRGEKLRKIRHEGLYYDIQSLLMRPVLMTGIVIFLFAMLYLPSRVLFVKVEGHVSIPENRILEAASQCGIRFGASRREVRSERMKNALLEAVPELQWAGVNTSGCLAVISVRERSLNDSAGASEFASGITAARDGIITSCTATKGNLLCAPGQAVKAGELLISGYTDCGLTIRVSGAEGEIYAQTIRNLQVKMPLACMKRGPQADIKHQVTLLLGKKRINLWKDSGIWDTTCGRIYSENYVTLPGGFRLPLGLAVETYFCSEWEAAQLSQEEAKSILQEAAQPYLLEQMIAGQILSSEYWHSVTDGVCTLAGEYVCTEMIGKVQREQMGEYNGENR